MNMYPSQVSPPRTPGHGGGGELRRRWRQRSDGVVTGVMMVWRGGDDDVWWWPEVLPEQVVAPESGGGGRSRRSVKVKELQERCFIHAFNLKKSMSMLVQKSQVYKMAIISQDGDKRLCLVDDLKKFKFTYKSSYMEQAQA
ncbi:hypothetical protein Tco_0951864 [Tanacetum coccineum]|uniref:Uncharacterized protein n=1 Tax=Tanacetum coccineum TaxID=301880 RepID=A0ABQ5E246_9ASTR